MLNIEVSPWRETGTHIAVLVDYITNPLHPGNPYQWALEVCKEIEKHTDRPIKVWVDPFWSMERHLGKGLNVLEHLPILNTDEIYEDCWATVSYASRQSIQSAIKGIPNISLDKGSFVTSLTQMSLEDIENPSLPDREQWLYDLSYTQWSFREISNGTAYKHLTRNNNGD